jgi:hypothetical protein
MRRFTPFTVAAFLLVSMAFALSWRPAPTLAATPPPPAPTAARGAAPLVPPTAALPAPSPAVVIPIAPLVASGAPIMGSTAPNGFDPTARLVLAQIYLSGGDYAEAVRLFAAVIEQDPTNSEALAGLDAALAARVAATASATAAALSATGTPEPTVDALFWRKWNDFAATTAAGVLLLFGLYLLAQCFRWVLTGLRELWLMRLIRLFGQPARHPGFIIGDFSDHTGLAGFSGTQIVAQTLTEKLLAWNQLVRTKEVQVIPTQVVDVAGMSWIRVLWTWLVPPPRGWRVLGGLLRDEMGNDQLTIQRVQLGSNRVDSSQTFESCNNSPEESFRAMANEAAKWLLNPREMEASAAAVRAPADHFNAGPQTASEIFDESLRILLPLRQQARQGLMVRSDAQQRLKDAQTMVGRLPNRSPLRRDLNGVIKDLQRRVPAA